MVSNTKNLKRFYDVAPDGACATEHACELHDVVIIFREGHAVPPCCGWVVVVHVLVFVPPPHVALHAATPQVPAQFIGDGVAFLRLSSSACSSNCSIRFFLSARY